MTPILLFIFLVFINPGQACQSKAYAPAADVESTTGSKVNETQKNTSSVEQTTPPTTGPGFSSTGQPTPLPRLKASTPPPPRPQTTPSPPITAVGKRKRAAVIAKMTVVNYVNHARPDIDYQEVFQSSIERFAEMIGYDKDDFALEKIEDEDGKIAVSYSVNGVDCEKLHDLAQKLMDYHTMDHITFVTIKCGGKPEYEIN
ncbi:hypothetical protein Aduo_007735 [Ancylostoma duodenale]